MTEYQRKANRTTGSRFLSVFVVYTVPGEWVTARELAGRIWPSEVGPKGRGEDSPWVKEVSRKLSNLERTGLLVRRPCAACFEYAKPPVPDTSHGAMPP